MSGWSFNNSAPSSWQFLCLLAKFVLQATHGEDSWFHVHRAETANE